jgi:hypothetical protein
MYSVGLRVGIFCCVLLINRKTRGRTKVCFLYQSALPSNKPLNETGHIVRDHPGTALAKCQSNVAHFLVFRFATLNTIPVTVVMPYHTTTSLSLVNVC